MSAVFENRFQLISQSEHFTMTQSQSEFTTASNLFVSIMVPINTLRVGANLVVTAIEILMSGLRPLSLAILVLG